MAANPLFAQFYSGHQMDFGKNRVQYSNFFWTYYDFERFDVYFNQDGEAIARFTGEHVAKHLSELESRLDHRLEKDLKLIVYNKYTDFKQSNLGLTTGKTANQPGGETQVRQNKISLFFQGDHKAYIYQLRQQIAWAIIEEIVYGPKLRENLANSSTIDLPDWYIQGLSRYLSEGWTSDKDNKLKVLLEKKRLRNFAFLQGEDALIAGQSFWRFIDQSFQRNIIPDLLILTRLNKNPDKAFLYATGYSLKELLQLWKESEQNKYADYPSFMEEEQGKTPLSGNTNSILYHFTQHPKESILAFVENKKGKIRIKLNDFRTGNTQKIYEQGYAIHKRTDLTYPVLCWHPQAPLLAFITEKEGKLVLYYYNFKDETLNSRNFLYFDKVLHMDFSPQGNKLLLTGVKNARSDVYLYDIASGTHEALTNDLADDFETGFIDAKNIFFTSNRCKDSLNCNSDEDFRIRNRNLFTLNLSSKEIKQLSFYQHSDLSSPETHNENYFYLNNQTGDPAIYKGIIDSSILLVDTAIHYGYYLKESLLYRSTDHLEDFSQKPGNITVFARSADGYYRQDVRKSNYSNARTKFQKNLKQEQLVVNDTSGFWNDTLAWETVENYSDINQYVFETEKPYFNRKYPAQIQEIESPEDLFPPKEIYQKKFYINQVVNQVDFGFLNTSYQAFSGGAVYFNPGINGLFKLGTKDLMEDYKIMGGFRVAADLSSSEFLVSYENLKPQNDRHYIFHFQNFREDKPDEKRKTTSTELIAIRTFPRSEAAAWQLSIKGRYDRIVSLSTSKKYLQKPNINRYWINLKGSYIFDNSTSIQTNIREGMRLKIFGEAFYQINKLKSDIFILGGDLRYYLPIHKNLIWANRLAGSSSFGHKQLVYYLGGVDNWVNLSPGNPTFIPVDEIPLSRSDRYVFQAVATNMRGFPQNIRNGNNFALFNSELRFPFVSYFNNFPSGSSFWNNLQLVGFFDLGTAWTGLHPWAGNNEYEYETIQNGPISITLELHKEPLVAGYGMGLRAKLLGYFVRLDYAWGIENQKSRPGMFYFSLSLDF